MGVCSSTGNAEAKRRDAEIERQLKDDHVKQQQEVKLLLLGPGESGKSTIFKQMKIIQKDGGYSKKELEDLTYTVYGNVITQMKVIVTVALKLKIDMEKPENSERAQRIAAIPAGGDSWTVDVANDIKELWQDGGIRHVWEMRDRKYHLNESASYFFDSIDRFVEPSYLPTYQDVLRARVRTTGIQEALFQFENISFRMLDVGGQRSERRKWIHCVAAGEPVTLGDGLTLPIERVAVGTAVPAWATRKGGLEPTSFAADAHVSGGTSHTVSAVLDQGHRACVALRLVDGQSLVCTPDHRVLGAGGVYVEAGSLRRGDTVVCSALVGVNDADSLDADAGSSFTFHGLRVADAAERSQLLALARIAGALTANPSGAPCCDEASNECSQSMARDATACDVSLAARLCDLVTGPSNEVPASLVREFFAGAVGSASCSVSSEALSVSITSPAAPTFARLARLLLVDARGGDVHSIVESPGAVTIAGASAILSLASLVGARHCVSARASLTLLATAARLGESDVCSVARDVRFNLQRRTLELAVVADPVVLDGGKPRQVYDLSVPNAHSFVAGASGIIAHNCFDSVTAVIFVVALSEYDQTLREGKENRMLESLALFADICNSRWFKNTAFILFLNKTDLFKEKVKRVDMKDHCFPDYTGGLDFDKALSYIKQRFLERNLSTHPVYVHNVVAVDTDNIKFVFSAVRETLLVQVLNQL
uniref:Guanine nucleotide-binding protein subunit alpha n=1 Tax=Sexangularia sp. CB-2014 TaxID=1486929 RepID=A0A7S1V9K0_9EUKA|mmetsp:Transcript_14436/g.45392  ORF Transcript_14436/g.45392 Transcript_14436/m.45392 type:complete len:711 (+) Transcript_14436:127-2259(+)|eukprot:CAMPEP_0170743310 /NCGR_PEP_ID=MMETSP0437-20130122/7198_1 /TAXON_ID=0 /ORGANISM="Sexangularia sp." /LENGTH=710 /DNA_ID=CAMNT_0011081967 /DNA_START=76 /DNA_END=2208 /DNA_ORIENTATION=+